MVSLVRPADVDDAAAIAAVHVAAWRSTYRGLLPDELCPDGAQTTTSIGINPHRRPTSTACTAVLTRAATSSSVPSPSTTT